MGHAPYLMKKESDTYCGNSHMRPYLEHEKRENWGYRICQIELII